MTQNTNVKIEKYNENKCYRCFNNKEIKIKGVIHMDITFGSWCAKIWTILIVEQNTTNLLGRDVLPKLGISLQQTKQQDKTKLKHLALPKEALWALDQDSEPDLDIQFKDEVPPQTAGIIAGHLRFRECRHCLAPSAFLKNRPNKQEQSPTRKAEAKKRTTAGQLRLRKSQKKPL